MARDSIDIGIVFKPIGIEAFDKIRQEFINIAKTANLSNQQFQQFIQVFDEAIRQGHSFVSALNAGKRALQDQSKSVLDFQDMLASLTDSYRNMSLEELQRYKLGLKIQDTFLGQILKFASKYAAATSTVRQFLITFDRYLGGLGSAIAAMLSFEEVIAKVWHTFGEGIEISVEFNSLLGPLQKNIGGMTKLYMDLGVKAAASAEDVRQLLEGFESYPLVIARVRKDLVNIGSETIRLSKGLDISIRSMSQFISQMILFQWRGQITAQQIEQLGQALAKLPVPAREIVEVLNSYIPVLTFMGIKVENVIKGIGELHAIMKTAGGSVKEFLDIGKQLAAVTMPDYGEALAKTVILQQLVNQNIQGVSVSLEEMRDFLMGNIKDSERLNNIMYSLGLTIYKNKQLVGVYAELLGLSTDRLMSFANFAALGRKEFMRQAQVMREQVELHNKISNFYMQVGPIITRLWAAVVRILQPLVPVLERIAGAFETIADAMDKLADNPIAKAFIQTGFLRLALNLMVQIITAIEMAAKFLLVRGGLVAAGRAGAGFGIGRTLSAILGLGTWWGWAITAALVAVPYVWDWLKKQDNSEAGNRRQEKMSDYRVQLDMQQKLGYYTTPF